MRRGPKGTATNGPAKGRSKGPSKHAGIASAAVAERTGRGWEAWFELLDRAGAGSMDHPAIARTLHEEHGVPGWWSQMITVGYEQARGRRVRHQTPRGFEVSVSRTVGASRAAVWRSLTDAQRRREWVTASSWDVRTQKAPERMRLRWPDGTTVEFRLVAKGPARTQVVASHLGLPNGKRAAWTKAFWQRALTKLEATIGG